MHNDPRPSEDPSRQDRSSDPGGRAAEPVARRRLLLGFDRALLASGWQDDVLLTVEDGRVASIRVDVGDAGRDGVEWFDGAVVAGMPNVHSHAHQRFMAGLGERSGPGRDSFWTWRNAMYSFAGRIGPAHLEAVAAMVYLEMLEAGFTAVGEFQYLHRDPGGGPYDDPAEMTLRCLAAARTAGVAVTLLPVLYRRPGFAGGDLEGGQRRFRAGLEDVLAVGARIDEVAGDDPGVRWGIAPHSLRAVAMEELVEAVLATRRVRPDAPIHLHIAEQRREVDDCRRAHGVPPVTHLLDSLDRHSVAVDDRWCLIHATHLDDDESRRLAEAGACVGVCPTTEANLGDGVFRARDHLDGGGALAIGSDSHIRVDVAEELRQLETSQRLAREERTVLTGGPDRSNGRFLFERAARGGARAMDLAAGAIDVGLRADLVRLDAHHPRLLGRRGDALLDAWIFAAGADVVSDVWVGGSRRVRNGRHVRRDEILDRFRAALEELGGSPPADDGTAERS